MIPVKVDATGVVKEVMSGLDALFTSDEERAAAKLAAHQATQHPHILQALTNLESAKHPSLFVAGARPAMLWLCIACLGYAWIFRDLLMIALTTAGVTATLPEIDTADLMTLVLALLGLGGMRTYEGIKGVKRDNLRPDVRTVRPSEAETQDAGLESYLRSLGVAVKHGVDLHGVDLKRMGPVIRAAKNAYDAEGVETVITSAYRPKDKNSLHSKGLALDFRTRHLEPGRDGVVANAIQAQLGHEYDVINESDKVHIHVEYDPR